jgi:MazG family protein
LKEIKSMQLAPVEADPLARLLTIMARLRDPDGGCAWDLEQTFATIAPYTIEEAYEVSDAIERGNLAELKDELGDLLLQVVFHSRMAEEQGEFAFADVAQAICDKMIRRHPHVFGEASHRDAAEQTVAWEAIKAEERTAKDATQSLLDGVPNALPALTRAEKLTRRAARVGFTWATPEAVIEKLHEELGELAVEVAAGDRAKMRDEMGDVLFVCANLARLLEIDPEDALRSTNAKFTRRFNGIEQALAADGRSPERSDLAEMDELWNAAKRGEKRKGEGA